MNRPTTIGDPVMDRTHLQELWRRLAAAIAQSTFVTETADLDDCNEAIDKLIEEIAAEMKERVPDRARADIAFALEKGTGGWL